MTRPSPAGTNLAPNSAARMPMSCTGKPIRMQEEMNGVQNSAKCLHTRPLPSPKEKAAQIESQAMHPDRCRDYRPWTQPRHFGQARSLMMALAANAGMQRAAIHSRYLCTAARALRSSLSVPLFSTRTPPKLRDVAAPDRPPVIMMHGVLASESTYRSILKRPDFVPHRELIAIDLRNHGKSPHLSPEDGMRYEDMAGDVSAFLEAEGIEQACLIGHSMGGKVAMQLALSEPEKVSELVVVDVAPINYTPGTDPSVPFTAMKAMRAINLENVTMRAQVDAALLVGGVQSKLVRQFVMTNLVLSTNPNSKYHWKVNLPAVEEAFPGLMTFPEQNGRTYTGPTCVIRGGKSKYVPFQSMRVFISMFPKTKLVTISEAGHWPQAQSPDDFCKAVNDFLGD